MSSPTAITRSRFFFTAVAGTLILLAPLSAVWAGKVIIGGDDLTLHGSYSSGTNHQGWLYIQKAMENIFASGCVTRPNDGSVAAIGVTNSTVSTGGDAGAAIHYAAQVALGKTVEYLEGPASIGSYLDQVAAGTKRPAVIWIASNYDISNDLDNSETDVLAAKADILKGFVNSGGALMAHTEGFYPGGNPWLGIVIPGLKEVSGCSSYGAHLTPEGAAAFLGLLDSDIDGSAGPCHTHFTGIGSLKVLAYDSDSLDYIVGGDCNTEIGPCSSVDSIMVSTGWDQFNARVFSVGDVDNDWTVISDPDAGTTEPRPAFVVPTYNPILSWAYPQTNTQWISSYPTSVDDLNGHYVFRYRFCLSSTAGASLRLSLRADDIATVYLNGTSLGTTPTYSFRSDRSPSVFSTANTGLFVHGENVLQIDVQNTQNVAMGLDIAGSIHGDVPLYHYCCTDSSGGLVGAVWNDVNGDGVRQSSEGGLSNRIVHLSTGRSTTTDVHGNYYFLDLVPGIYSVTQTLPSGWTQTAAPSMQVIVGLGEIRQGQNFGTTSGTSSVPTLNNWGLTSLTLLIGFTGLMVLARRRTFNGSKANY